MELGILDIVFIAIIVVAALRGAFRGMIQEIISLAALFISLLLAAVYYPDTARWIRSRSSIDDGSTLIAYAFIFLVSFILFKLLQKAVVSMMNESAMESTDRLLGFFFGMLEGVLICFLLVYLINFQHLLNLDGLSGDSLIVPYLERFLPALDKPAAGLLDRLKGR
jgi:membrane protein required for colicin V production